MLHFHFFSKSDIHCSFIVSTAEEQQIYEGEEQRMNNAALSKNRSTKYS